MIRSCLCSLRCSFAGHYPVKRSLTPLQGRGIPPRQAELDTPPKEGNCRLRFGELEGASGCTPPRQAELDTPPKEGNCRLRFGELEGASGCTPPRQAELDTPPKEGNCRLRFGELEGASGCTPPRQAELDTPLEEGNCLVQIRGHHPVKRSLTPLQRRGIALCRYEDTTLSSGA